MRKVRTAMPVGKGAPPADDAGHAQAQQEQHGQIDVGQFFRHAGQPEGEQQDQAATNSSATSAAVIRGEPACAAETGCPAQPGFLAHQRPVAPLSGQTAVIHLPRCPVQDQTDEHAHEQLDDRQMWLQQVKGQQADEQILADQREQRQPPIEKEHDQHGRDPDQQPPLDSRAKMKTGSSQSNIVGKFIGFEPAAR